MKGHWLMAFVVFAVAFTFAGDALACPYCAGRDDGDLSATLVVGAMMMVPFVVVGVVWPIVSREEGRDLADPRTGEDSTCG